MKTQIGARPCPTRTLSCSPPPTKPSSGFSLAFKATTIQPSNSVLFTHFFLDFSTPLIYKLTPIHSTFELCSDRSPSCVPFSWALSCSYTAAMLFPVSALPFPSLFRRVSKYSYPTSCFHMRPQYSHSPPASDLWTKVIDMF